MQFKYKLPKTNLLFERGGIQKLGEEAAKFGDSALLVTGESSMKRLGFLDKALNVLGETGVKALHYAGVKPNPTVEIVDRGADLALKGGCEIIIALGGGSTIDTAKGIAVVAGHGGGGIWEYVPEEKQGGGLPITSKTLPIIAIPSTSGTGSHVTPYAVITDPKTGGKPGFGDDSMFPDLSIVDIDILKEMPERLTAVTGFDVFTHASENLVARGNHPISDPWALRAVEIVSDYLPRALGDRSDIRAREMMALADTYAGLSNTATSTNLRHAMAHSISGHYPNIAHGQALASIAVSVMEFNLEKADERTKNRYAKIAERMGGEKRAEEAIKRIKNLIESLDLDKSLLELGVEEKKIHQMSSDVFSYMGKSVKNNPVPVSKEEIEYIYKKSF